jgi:hypothetical protein
MERRPHPRYFRKVAGFSFGLFGTGMACLLGGVILQRFGLPLVSDVLYFAFVGTAIIMLVFWFSAGESTTCPQCGKTLHADPHRDRDDNLTFVCQNCEIEWDTGALHDT